MRPIRNSSSIELWAQAANPLDEYLAALRSQQAQLGQSRREACEALLQPAHRLIGRTSDAHLSQFELIAELSHEMADVPRCVSLVPTRRIAIVPHPVCAALDLQASSRPIVHVLPGSAMRTLVSQSALAGGVDIPGLIKESRCDIEQQRPLMEALETSAANHVTGVQPQEPGRGDGGEPGREPASGNAPFPAPLAATLNSQEPGFQEFGIMTSIPLSLAITDADTP